VARDAICTWCGIPASEHKHSEIQCDVAPEPRDEAPRWLWALSHGAIHYLLRNAEVIMVVTQNTLPDERKRTQLVDTLNAGEEAREWGKEYADGDLIERGELDEARTERDALQERVTALEDELDGARKALRAAFERLRWYSSDQETLTILNSAANHIYAFQHPDSAVARALAGTGEGATG